jgi:hypothetical protein
MRSRAELARVSVEWVLRALALMVVVAWLARTLAVQRRGATDAATSATLIAQLSRWSTASEPARVSVDMQSPPAARERDWLGALPGAGTAVTWSGRGLAATAVSIEPLADPGRVVDVSLAAPRDDVVVLADSIGSLDSVRVTLRGARRRLLHPGRSIDAITGAVTARAALRDSLELKRILVVGEAGWEGKFAVAALEERGWKVDAHLAVSPKGDVHQGTVVDIDTAKYAAVLGIDTVALRYADRIARFVRQGGGLVLWSPAARGALASVAAGLPAPPIADDGGEPPDSAPRSVLELAPITALTNDAITLEKRGDNVALAARRVDAGRVVETGYTDSWRWRMAGGADAANRHREWLAGLVASVAYAPRHELAAEAANPAPLAALIDRLGEPSRSAPEKPWNPELLARWAAGLLAAALLLEWASRRLRGAR